MCQREEERVFYGCCCCLCELQGSNSLPQNHTHTNTRTHAHRVAQAGTLSLPRWAEDKNSISCWLLLQKCAFLGDLSPQGGWGCFIAALRCCALFLFRFPFFQAQTHTHSHAHSHTHMQLQQACFKMCGKREKKKLKQEKRAKLHFRRRRRCCRSSIATCSSQSRCRIQWRAAKGDLYFPLSLSVSMHSHQWTTAHPAPAPLTAWREQQLAADWPRLELETWPGLAWPLWPGLLTFYRSFTFKKQQRQQQITVFIALLMPGHCQCVLVCVCLCVFGMHTITCTSPHLFSRCLQTALPTTAAVPTTTTTSTTSV